MLSTWRWDRPWRVLYMCWIGRTKNGSSSCHIQELNLGTGLGIQCTSQPAMTSHWGIKKGHINSFYTKDRTSSPTTQNAAVRRTAYAVRALKNLRQISHMVCTKPMVIAPFHNLFWCKCTLSSAATFVLGSLVLYFQTDLALYVTHSVKKHAFFIIV